MLAGLEAEYVSGVAGAVSAPPDPPPLEAPPARQPARFVGGIGIRAKKGAERTPRELREPTLRPFLGPRSSSFERLKQVRIF
eukprot:14274417-Alexandrium_andersonii.AAC.1